MTYKIEFWPQIERWYRQKYNYHNKRLKIIRMEFVRIWLFEKFNMVKVPYAEAVLYQPDWEVLKDIYLEKLPKGPWKCTICSRALEDYEMDHVIPIAAGGLEFALSNIRIVCLPCNDQNTPAKYKKKQNVEKLRRSGDFCEVITGAVGGYCPNQAEYLFYPTGMGINYKICEYHLDERRNLGTVFELRMPVAKPPEKDEVKEK